MSAQSSVVLNWSTRHGEKSVFEALTETIASLESVDQALLDDYRVIWGDGRPELRLDFIRYHWLWNERWRNNPEN